MSSIAQGDELSVLDRKHEECAGIVVPITSPRPGAGFADHFIDLSITTPEQRGRVLYSDLTRQRAAQERFSFLACFIGRATERLGACIRAAARFGNSTAQRSPLMGGRRPITAWICRLLPTLALGLVLGSGFTARAEPNEDATEALISGITRWLSDNFDLPAPSEHPRLAFVSRARMAEIRYGIMLAAGVAGARLSASPFAPETGQELGGMYDDAHRTIYLPEGWSTDSPAEVSVLVHEMVHYLQSVAALKYECPQAREKQAYAAQERWLGLSGLNLESAFGMDGMTMLVRTRCLG